MEARPSKITEFFDGTRQMVVPLFQRPYEWTAQHWQALWDDLLEQYERGEDDALATHFTGAIVTAPARSVPVGVSKFLVIDGQQRLTTIAVLLCAIRTFLPEDSREFRRLTRLLVNEDYDELEAFKLLPTQPDRAAFRGLVRGAPIGGTRFTDALEFFKKKIAGRDSEDNPIDVERLTNAVQNRMTVVSINLGDSDDPYLIFESLNAKGAPLTQADLIRNYLLLRLRSEDQQASYEEAWLPMQGLLPGDNLTEFMRQYLMMTGEEVAKSSIYSVLKRRLLSVADGSIAAELRRMQQASLRYAAIVGLEDATEPALATALARLRRWEIATANPFVLKLLGLHAAGGVSTAEVVKCLSTIESFAVRRAVCSVPTNQLKRIFLSAAKEMPEPHPASRPNPDVHEALVKGLTAGGSGRRWPKDDEFKKELLGFRAYATQDRCKFLLESLEVHHGHRELATFEKATIEHVMPQTLTDEWRAMLGEGTKDVHEKCLDVLGNLTLTAYNSELSNSPFSRKRELLGESHFALNAWIATQERWTADEILARTELLFARAREIWPRPE